jgi:hypothetical protein
MHLTIEQTAGVTAVFQWQRGSSLHGFSFCM